MLTEAYPNIEITMDTYLEYGTGCFLDMSSIEIVQFILNLEKKFNIIIDLDERYYTIGDAVKSVYGYINEEETVMSGEKCESKI